MRKQRYFKFNFKIRRPWWFDAFLMIGIMLPFVLVTPIISRVIVMIYNLKKDTPKNREMLALAKKSYSLKANYKSWKNAWISISQ